MEIIIGLLIIAVGSFAQSSSYVPINKVKGWSWESYWLVQGIFAWIVFPLIGILFVTVPTGVSIFDLYAGQSLFGSIFYGMLWGIGGLTFGLSMRYLGVAMGQSIALGTCSAFGTLFPALFAGENLFAGEGLVLLIGVSIAIAGIAVIGYAGALRSKNMSIEDQRKAVKEFALTKGLIVALMAGVMSACFNLGLGAGKEIEISVRALGASEMFSLTPVILLVTLGGAITNFTYCIFQNIKNKTFSDYVQGRHLINNLLFCVLAGCLWYSQFFGLSMGKAFLQDSPVMIAFSWSILMSLNILFSNVWGLILKEWKGVGRKTYIILSIGLAILIFSLIFPNII